jgi:hypothetical protein
MIGRRIRPRLCESDATMTEHPAGWHPDPSGRHEHRYWDGTHWTDHVADGGVASTDPLTPEAVEEDVPIGPSMVNMPAIDPSLLQQSPQPAGFTPGAVPAPQPQPEPSASAGPAAGSTGAPGGHRASAGPEDALEKASDAFENAAASLAHKPLSVAALLTVAAPGMGHVYLGVSGGKRTTAFILLAATLAAVIVSGFVYWPLGLLIYLVALTFAMLNLSDELAPLKQQRATGGPLATFSDLGSALAWRLVALGGALLAVSLFLPWYRLSTDSVIGEVTLTLSAFDSFKLIDLILLVIGAGATALAILNIQQGTANRPVAGQLATIVAAAGAAALLLVLFRLLFVPDNGFEFGIERSFGALLAFASSVLLAGGAAGAASSKS